MSMNSFCKFPLFIWIYIFNIEISFSNFKYYLIFSNFFLNYFVGVPRLELGTSASKADVLTNYTAYPNFKEPFYFLILYK